MHKQDTGLDNTLAAGLTSPGRAWSAAWLPSLAVRKNIAFAGRSGWPDWRAGQADAQVEKYIALAGLSAALNGVAPTATRKGSSTRWA